MARTRKDISKDDFIKAAEKLIADKGANGFSLAELALAMGISKGTLFYYYPTKDDLILDIIKQHMTSLSKDYVEWLNRHKNDQITPERFLDVIFYKGVKLFNKAKMHIYLINECLRGNEELRKNYVGLWDSWEAKLEEGLAQAFPKEKDREAFAYLLMLVIDGLTVQEALGHSDADKNERMKTILVRGQA
jgi:AcrR family transcriptional regulator